MSSVFCFLRRFLVKLTPTLQASRDRIYADFTISNVALSLQRNSLKMLDVGGADGRLTHTIYKKLAFMGYNVFVVVLDRDLSTLHSGKKLHKSLEYVCGDANHLPFKYGAFDVVCSYSLLEHSKRSRHVAKEMALASKGVCIIQIPNLRYFIEPHTKAPLLFIFPHLVRERVVQITNPGMFLNFNVSNANIIEWFKRVGFTTVSCLKVYHTRWTKALIIPPSFLLSFRMFGHAIERQDEAMSLVRLIGIPNLVKPTLLLEVNETLKFLPSAKLNKIPLLFLESARDVGRHPPLEAQLSRYRDRHKKTLDLITLVSSLLKVSGIRYTIFKTLKPFPYTPADIDVLLWSSRDLTKASKILEKKGFKSLDRDLYGLTMFSVDHSLNVDLTTEVAASSFIYLDKNRLFKHVSQVKVDGFKVQTLKPHADLVTVAAHCMYKEQMYTLSDYYTFALSPQCYQEASELAESAHAKFALEAALKLTYDITINAFGSDNNLIERLKNLLQTIDMSGMTQTGKRFDLPMKYPPSIVLRGLSKKLLEDPVSRNSLATALKSTLQPKSINRLLKHIMRKGY